MTIDERLRELLEDFEVVSTTLHMALIPRLPGVFDIEENIRTAVVASTLRLSGLDYAKKTYIKNLRIQKRSENDSHSLYIKAYKMSKQYVTDALSRLKTKGRELPSLGEFGASLVLERLVASFFSAHLLYCLGNAYEGHAVSRLILEQISWAYAAATLKSIDDIKKIETTKCISKLASFYLDAGKLYGFLSKKTHIEYETHHEFLSVKDGKNAVLLGQPRFL